MAYFIANKKKIFSLSLFLILPLLFFFQNCANSNIGFKEVENSFNSISSCEENAGTVGCQIVPLTCEFSGQTLAEGQTVTAYLSSAADSSQKCVSEQRVCANGSLGGTYRYTSCQPYVERACLFNGREIPHGGVVQAYKQSTVGYGNSCAAEARTCKDGVLSGSAPFASCEVGEAMACLFDGKTLKHSESVRAYSVSSVSYGAQCASEIRVCSNGVMTGSFGYTACSVDGPKACLFNGQNVAHGESVQAFAASSMTGSPCAAEVRSCQNGILSGSLPNASCSQAQTDSNAGSLCGQVRNVQGDMRVFVEPGTNGEISKLEFGTFADNYWNGDRTKGQSYTRKLSFQISDLASVVEFKLVQAAYDDWLLVKVNGKNVYIGPKENSDRLILSPEGRVQYSASGFSVPELSTSWNFKLNKDLRPHLVAGENVIETQTIVAGGGESAIKIEYLTQCGPSSAQ